MTQIRKIINDPLYGFIDVYNDFILSLINDPLFQRLRHIQQLSLSAMVYPGAVHTRFHHSLGVMYLMQLCLDELRRKSIEISELEYESALIVALLHDVGHGPYSHTLEHSLIKEFHHEELSLYVMKQLNEKHQGRLDTAIAIFENSYHRKFFYQLISGAIDVDRMDYLNRDSFYSGVVEGSISVHRLIKMIHVSNDQICFEEKGVLSIENFFFSRKIMYLQVYLHKTVVGLEELMILLFSYLTNHIETFPESFISKHKVLQLLSYSNNKEKTPDLIQTMIHLFFELDDSDVWYLIKDLSSFEHDSIACYLSQCIRNRKIYKSIKNPNEALRKELYEGLNLSETDPKIKPYLLIEKSILFHLYDHKQPTFIKFKDNSLIPFEQHDLMREKQWKNEVYPLSYLYYQPKLK
ncbi:MAG: HD domain-containing protein [Chitinophagales bacterium]|jgi:hypothetical protein|nr:HD domain-containing protein [Chitinophagales bacterium]